MTTATDGAPRLEPGCDRCHARPARPLTPITITPSPATMRDAATVLEPCRPLTPLTTRQMEVARLLAAGLSRRQVAARLGCSEHTVRAHITHIALKLPGDGNLRARITSFISAGA